MLSERDIELAHPYASLRGNLPTARASRSSAISLVPPLPGRRDEYSEIGGIIKQLPRAEPPPRTARSPPCRLPSRRTRGPRAGDLMQKTPHTT